MVVFPNRRGAHGAGTHTLHVHWRGCGRQNSRSTAHDRLGQSVRLGRTNERMGEKERERDGLKQGMLVMGKMGDGRDMASYEPMTGHHGCVQDVGQEDQVGLDSVA